MRSDRSVTERILNVLRPYASNWSGTLGRCDLVIPQREIPRVIHEILDALHEDAATRKERRVAHEMDGVAKTLLGVKKNGLAPKRMRTEP